MPIKRISMRSVHSRAIHHLINQRIANSIKSYSTYDRHLQEAYDEVDLYDILPSPDIRTILGVEQSNRSISKANWKQSYRRYRLALKSIHKEYHYMFTA